MLSLSCGRQLTDTTTTRHVARLQAPEQKRRVKRRLSPLAQQTDAPWALAWTRVAERASVAPDHAAVRLLH
jgi:hypothetical protein